MKSRFRKVIIQSFVPSENTFTWNKIDKQNKLPRNTLARTTRFPQLLGNIWDSKITNAKDPTANVMS